jgi:GNAT superfamily N-acetyltransferase
MTETLTIRPADSDEDCKRIFLFLCDHMLLEVARATIDPNKAFIDLYSVVNEHAAFIVENEDGEIVASAGIVEMTGGLWYGIPERYLTEKWFFVRKDYRNTGRALSLMLKEVRDLADHLEAPAYLMIWNPEKARSPARTKRETFPVVGYKLAYTPAGRMIVVQPPRGTS